MISANHEIPSLQVKGKLRGEKVLYSEEFFLYCTPPSWESLNHFDLYRDHGMRQ